MANPPHNRYLAMVLLARLSQLRLREGDQPLAPNEIALEHRAPLVGGRVQDAALVLGDLDDPPRRLEILSVVYMVAGPIFTAPSVDSSTPCMIR